MSSALRERIEGKHVVICAGSGGVGKTTTSAALAMGLAASGLRVAVVTIDPARRLANSLGLETLGNEPKLIDPARFAAHGVEIRGELWAMMLDAKRTFDELIERHASDERTRDAVLSNRIYQELSSAVAGSQEFTAVAKLYELSREGGYDVVVLDTPPSRPVRAALMAHARARAQRAQLGRLRRTARAPVVTLPFVSAPMLDAATIEPLVRALERAV